MEAELIIRTNGQTDERTNMKKAMGTFSEYGDTPKKLVVLRPKFSDLKMAAADSSEAYIY